MRSQLFNLAAGLSMLLCVAVVSLWIATYWYFFQVSYTSAPDIQGISCSYFIFASASAVHGSRWRGQLEDSGVQRGWECKIRSQKELGTSRWTGGLLFYYRSRMILFRSDQLGIPCWALALLFLILPLIWTRRRRNLRRQKIESVPNGPPQPDDPA
jgi:hypothetical protein